MTITSPASLSCAPMRIDPLQRNTRPNAKERKHHRHESWSDCQSLSHAVLLAGILTNRDGGMENRSSDTNRSLPGKVARPRTVLPVENWAWPFVLTGPSRPVPRYGWYPKAGPGGRPHLLHPTR